MNGICGEDAINLFLQRYGNQLEFDNRNTNTLKISIPLGNGQEQTFLLDKLYQPEIGGEEKVGIAFTLSQLPNYGMNTSIARIDPDSDLGFYIKSQVMPDFNLNIGNTFAVYDLASLIPHDPEHHGVNFDWVESLTDVVVPNDFQSTGLSVLFDYVEALAGSLDVEKGLLIGERGRLYAPALSDKYRLGIPTSCSRPQGQKMLRDIVDISSKSGYAAESGDIENADELDEKSHMVKRSFMEGLKGIRTAVMDDLDATRNTMLSFINAVKEYGGIPVPITVVGLEYVYTDPELIKKGLIANIEEPIHSIFIEHAKKESPVLTQEMKQAWDMYRGN